MFKLLALVLDNKYVILSGGANVTHYNLNVYKKEYNSERNF